ncbi:MAG TPA: hypothetical protein VK206_18845 [Anaerolineales bacterium]|nr:hypothetical protein [Anaerolineales bacterium]
MTRITLKQQWQAFQRDKVHKIRSWYAEHYEHASVDDPLIKYIVLWSVFNALYNVYDAPNNKLPEKMHGRYKFKKRFGYKVPIIIVAGDSDRLRKFAKKLASLESLVDIVNHASMRNLIDAFVNRIPAVAQREGVDPTEQVPIVYKDEDGEWVEDLFSPTAIHGVASLDHRLFLADGYKFFEFAAIESPWNDEGDLIDLEITAKQLLNVLYQLRNNVVHGGVVSDKRKSIINDALPILQKFVEFVFSNVDQIYTGERE